MLEVYLKCKYEYVIKVFRNLIRTIYIYDDDDEPVPSLMPPKKRVTNISVFII